jgi:hypothetical protein
MRFAPLVALISLAALDGRLPAQAPVPPPPGEPKLLTVTLASGRTFTGHVDAATSDERLVLRFGREGVVLKRPIAWDRVARASADGQEIELPRLREAAAGMRSEGERVQVSGFRVQETPDREGETPAEPPVDARRIASISIDPRLANWDADVESDGIMIDVLPLDTDGYAAAAGGIVEVELFAPQRRVFHHAPLSGGDTLERVERWSRPVQPADFTDTGVRLKLPFGAVHPEFDLDWMGIGLVHAKFVAPGHGVFEDSRDAVRIRTFAPLRDQLEQKGYPRFLPTEGVGRWD